MKPYDELCGMFSVSFSRKMTFYSNPHFLIKHQSVYGMWTLWYPWCVLYGSVNNHSTVVNEH